MGTENETRMVTVRGEILQKTCYRTHVGLVAHAEEHSYQGVLTATRSTVFELRMERERGLNAPWLPYVDQDQELKFVLEADLSQWTDVADPDLEKRWDELVPVFDRECDAYRPGDVIQVTYSAAAREARIAPVLAAKPVLGWHTALVYYPFGFTTHTCDYTREGKLPPDVVSVALRGSVHKR